MRQDLFNCYPLIRIEIQHLRNQIQTLLTSSRHKLLLVTLLDLAQQLKHLMPRIDPQTFDLLLRRRPRPLQHLLQLVNRRRPRKQRLPPDHLSQHTPHTPNIYRLTVLPRTQQYLRSPVPPSRYILRQHLLVILELVLDRSHQPEITQLCLTVLVNQHVRRFDVPVNQPC